MCSVCYSTQYVASSVRCRLTIGVWIMFVPALRRMYGGCQLQPGNCLINASLALEERTRSS